MIIKLFNHRGIPMQTLLNRFKIGPNKINAALSIFTKAWFRLLILLWRLCWDDF